MKKFARPHVPEEELHAYADNQVSGGQRAEIAEHMTGCLICRAKYAEVCELRARTSEILALAVPMIPAALQATEPAAAMSQRESHKGRRGMMIAAAVAVTLVGSWMIQTDGTLTDARAALAKVIGAPALSASDIGSPDPAADPRATVESDAGTGPLAGWLAVSWEEAVRLNGGAPAHLDGLPITAVRIGNASPGTKATIMVRHALPDGSSAWVIEGAPSRVGPVIALLSATGMAASLPLAPTGRSAAPAGASVVAIAAFTTPDSVGLLEKSLRLR